MAFDESAVNDLPATEAAASLAAPDVVQLRLELGEVIDAAAGPLPAGVVPSQAGQFLPAEGDRPAGRVTGDGTGFQAVDALERSPLSDLFAGGAVADASRWSVTVNGEAVGLDAVSRKTNVLDSARVGPFVQDYEFATIENVFLDLAVPLSDGDVVEVAFDDPAFGAITGTVDTGATVSEAIHVNLAGFEPGAAKTAYLSSWNGVTAGGMGRPQDYDPDTGWRIVDEATGQTAAQGTVTLDKPAEEEDRGRNFALTDVWEIDFGALDDPGTYRVAVEGVGVSQPFEIGAGVMQDVHELALRGFYHQRSGIELGAPFGDFDRPASFPEGTEVIRSTLRISDTNEGYDRTDPNPKPLFADNATGEVLTDVSGGWHDAGDWDRRTQHLEASRRLLELAELEPGFAEGLDASIPESGNGIPDNVDEALWGLSVFLDLQDADGGVSGGVQSAGDPLFGEGSWSESQDVYAYAPDPWTTWEFAATAAKAAFVLEAYDPGLAAGHRDAALRAMEWAEARAEEAELDRPVVVNARNVAAAELYRLTGDERWNALYLETTVYDRDPSQIFPDTAQYEASFTYARTDRPGVDPAVRDAGLAEIADEARRIEESFEDPAFGQTYDAGAAYGFGTTFSQPRSAADLYVRLHALTGEDRWLELAEGSVQFALGANPLNLSYLSGLEGPGGEVRDPEELLVVDADTLGVDPPPGIVAYGTYESPRYAGFYTPVLNGTVVPGADERPVLETFDAYFYNIPATEFTVQQGMAWLTYVTGYLAAERSGSAAAAPPPEGPLVIELAERGPRNTVFVEDRDLLVRGFDVDGGGESSFDTLAVTLGGEIWEVSDAAGFAALAEALAADDDPATGAAADGEDLVLSLGGGIVSRLTGVVGPGGVAAPAPPSETEEPGRPEVLIWQAGLSSRTQFILPNAEHIEALPVDGIVIHVPASWSAMSPGVEVDAADLRGWVEPLAEFNAGMSNHLRITTDDPGDPFDDVAWARVAENWRVLAEEARAAGFEGLFYDDEEYFGEWQDFPEDYPAEAAERGLDAYRDQVALRGRQVMEAVMEAWPEAQVTWAHGPYLSVPGASEAVPAIGGQAGDWTLHELKGPFFTGMLEGLGPQGRLVDGGELYALRTEEEFAQSLAYRDDLGARIPWDAPVERWDEVDQGHIVYTDEFPPGFAQDPESFEATLDAAIARSEGPVIVYSEVEQLDWLTPGALPAPWLDALEAAVSAGDDLLA